MICGLLWDCIPAWEEPLPPQSSHRQSPESALPLPLCFRQTKSAGSPASIPTESSPTAGSSRRRLSPLFPREKAIGASVRKMFRQVSQYAFFTCLQQSVMNFGILMIQGLVNSFGTVHHGSFRRGCKKSTHWPICRCRSSATRSPCLFPESRRPGRPTGSAGASVFLSSFPSCSVW